MKILPNLFIPFTNISAISTRMQGIISAVECLLFFLSVVNIIAREILEPEYITI
ncbi:hypothetical protein [Methanosarcina horonobensis]|uniref:hypothetical protein n=1 Tax=Methanosarcina horonobensis TaxID=418008 RepID=UPI0013016D7E|nr:hypothetical protein [Methanosarcina horonobensis]